MRRIKAPAAARGKWSCCGLNRAEPLRVAGVEKVPDGDSRHLMAKIRDGTDERCRPARMATVRHGTHASDILRWCRNHRDLMVEHTARHFSKNRTG
jgi:hypothetical protein